MQYTNGYDHCFVLDNRGLENKAAILEDKESNLFAIGQQDIDAILEKEIGKLVANVENKQGEATIILGTIK